MDKEGIILNGIRIGSDFKEAELENNPLFQTLFQNRKLTIFSSVSDNIDFYGVQCRATVSFAEHQIIGIKLEPKVPDFSINRYPGEEDELVRWTYSKQVLERILGRPDESDETRVRYIRSYGVISTGRITEGKGMNTGGEIRIRFQR